METVLSCPPRSSPTKYPNSLLDVMHVASAAACVVKAASAASASSSSGDTPWTTSTVSLSERTCFYGTRLQKNLWASTFLSTTMLGVCSTPRIWSHGKKKKKTSCWLERAREFTLKVPSSVTQTRDLQTSSTLRTFNIVNLSEMWGMISTRSVRVIGTWRCDPGAMQRRAFLALILIEHLILTLTLNTGA